jgi:hypothetical protein
MILSLFIYALLAYLLYRLVFGFIIPVVRTTRRVKKSFRDMHERMNGQYAQQGGNPYGSAAHSQQQQTAAHKTTGSDDDDYIEFEEVK